MIHQPPREQLVQPVQEQIVNPPQRVRDDSNSANESPTRDNQSSEERKFERKGAYSSMHDRVRARHAKVNTIRN